MIYHAFGVNLCREFENILVRPVLLKDMFVYCSMFQTYIFFLSKVACNLYKMKKIHVKLINMILLSSRGRTGSNVVGVLHGRDSNSDQDHYWPNSIANIRL